MDSINITIDWVYFLGIMGVLLLIAWNASGKFSKLETDMTWVKKDMGWIKKTLNELKLGNDNKSTSAFMAHSPVSLTDKGISILNESGMKAFVDTSESILSKKCLACSSKNPYQIQQHIFDLFDSLKFPEKEFAEFQHFAFEKGISIEIIRRVGAIYYRDIFLKNNGHDRSDIDKHDPEKKV